MPDRPGILRNLRIKRVDLVDSGANFDPSTGDGAHIMLFKRHDPDVSKDGPGIASVHVDSPEWDLGDQDEYEKVTLTGPARRGLPDSAFAAVWTDAQGKKHRKLPIHDAGHLAAARGRIDAAQIPADVKAAARRKLEAASSHHNKEKSMPVLKVHGDKPTILSLITKTLGLFTETDVEKRKTAIEELKKEAEAAAPPAGSPAHEGAEDAAIGALAHLHPDHAKAMKAHHDHLGKMIESYGAGPHPDGHPVHALKALHAHIGKVLNECVSDEPGGLVGAEAPLSKQLVAKMSELEKRAKDAEAAVLIEKNLRLDREMVDILKAFKAVPFDLEKDTPKFRKMKEENPEAFDRTIAIMKATDAQLAASTLYKNVGSGQGGAAGSAWEQIEAKAATMVEKDTKGLTREQAIDKVCIANPKLAAQYRAEQQ